VICKCGSKKINKEKDGWYICQECGRIWQGYKDCLNCLFFKRTFKIADRFCNSYKKKIKDVKICYNFEDE